MALALETPPLVDMNIGYLRRYDHCDPRLKEVLQQLLMNGWYIGNQPLGCSVKGQSTGSCGGFGSDGRLPSEICCPTRLLKFLDPLVWNWTRVLHLDTPSPCPSVRVNPCIDPSPSFTMLFQAPRNVTYIFDPSRHL